MDDNKETGVNPEGKWSAQKVTEYRRKQLDIIPNKRNLPVADRVMLKLYSLLTFIEDEKGAFGVYLKDKDYIELKKDLTDLLKCERSGDIPALKIMRKEVAEKTEGYIKSLEDERRTNCRKHIKKYDSYYLNQNLMGKNTHKILYRNIDIFLYDPTEAELAKYLSSTAEKISRLLDKAKQVKLYPEKKPAPTVKKIEPKEERKEGVIRTVDYSEIYHAVEKALYAIDDDKEGKRTELTRYCKILMLLSYNVGFKQAYPADKKVDLESTVGKIYTKLDYLVEIADFKNSYARKVSLSHFKYGHGDQPTINI